VFVDMAVQFLAIAFLLYGLASLYQHTFHDRIIRPTTRCIYCRKWISEFVSRG